MRTWLFFSLKNEYPIQAHIRLLSTTTCNLWLPFFFKARMTWFEILDVALLHLNSLYNITYMLRKYVLHFSSTRKVKIVGMNKYTERSPDQYCQYSNFKMSSRKNSKRIVWNTRHYNICKCSVYALYVW